MTNRKGGGEAARSPLTSVCTARATNDGSHSNVAVYWRKIVFVLTGFDEINLLNHHGLTGRNRLQENCKMIAGDTAADCSK